jgi:hypothetical protein
MTYLLFSSQHFLLSSYRIRIFIIKDVFVKSLCTRYVFKLLLYFINISLAVIYGWDLVSILYKCFYCFYYFKMIWDYMRNRLYNHIFSVSKLHWFMLYFYKCNFSYIYFVTTYLILWREWRAMCACLRLCLIIVDFNYYSQVHLHKF